MFDGWAASHGVDPPELPWDRFLNLIYHFAVRNATKEKKQEFDQAISRVVSSDRMKMMSMSRKNALRSTESDENESSVGEDTIDETSKRRSKLPPRPAWWGDDETNTRHSLLAAQSLKVGAKTR